MRAYQVTAANAEVFFEICQTLNLKTEKERMKVLEVMAKEGFVDRIWDTHRSKEQFVKDISKHYKTLVINSEETNFR